VTKLIRLASTVATLWLAAAPHASAVTLDLQASSAARDQAALSARPVFVGRGQVAIRPQASLRSPMHTYTYMTAFEMQSTVVSLTGFLHPAFEAYADVLGRFDPVTGLRTNDRPSLISVFFMQKIAGALASAVIERELFLDDEERIVFQCVDLEAEPDDAALASLVDAMHTRWLGSPADAETVSELIAGFRGASAARGPTAGYEWLVSMLVRHGGLYYY
jgi:hypothetical protein